MVLPLVELRPYSGTPSVRDWFADEFGGDFAGGFGGYDDSSREYEPFGGCFLALLDGEPVAFVGTIVDGPRTWINPLVVSPDHRSRGIGRATLRRLIDDELVRGQLRCDIERENLASMRCFAALGFEENEFSTPDSARMALDC